MKRRYRARRLRKDDDYGIDDWLMTYADMITLLLCFFAVFLSVSVPKKEIFNEAREKVMEQFSATHIMLGQFPTPPSDAKSDTPYDALPSIVDQYHQGLGEATGEGIDVGHEGEHGPNDNANTNKNMYEKPPDGDRLLTIDMPSAAFFASGSAVLSDDGKKLLLDIAEKRLKAEDVKDFQITVEGHTDDIPIATAQFPSNWELSTSRAAAVVRFLIESGVEPFRLRAAGYADVLPKAPNRDGSGNALPENQAQNRRVVIKLEKVEKQG